MTSEELLTVLQELATNHDGILYDLDTGELLQLRGVVAQLHNTLQTVATAEEASALWGGGFDAVMQELQELQGA